MKDNWKTKSEFDYFVRRFPEGATCTPDDLAKLFFTCVEEQFHKHLAQWKNKFLQIMLAVKHEPVTFLASWLTGKPLPTQRDYISAKHGCTIDLKLMRSFFTESISQFYFHNSHFYLLHNNALE